MSFGDWVQRRRVHALVITIPICTAAYIVGAVLFEMVPFTRAALGSEKFLVRAIFWGLCLGFASAFLVRPVRFLKKE